MPEALQSAVILAAGSGKRLRPLTCFRSKAMMPVWGRPMVARVMDSLVANGFQDFVLVAAPSDREIARYVSSQAGRYGRVRLVMQASQRGSADALKQALPLLRGPFAVSACDSWLPPEQVALLLAGWQPTAQAVLGLMRLPWKQIAAASAVTTAGRNVTGIIEKPARGEAPSNLACLPLYLFNEGMPALLEQIEPSRRGEYEIPDAIQLAIERGETVLGVPLQQRRSLTTALDWLALNWFFMARSLRWASDPAG